MILQAQADIRVVGEARDGEEAIAEARRLRPDVVLMDVRMPRVDGIEATRRILGDVASPAHVLVLTRFDLDEYVHGALAAGASGFPLKDTSPEQLVLAIRRPAPRAGHHAPVDRTLHETANILARLGLADRVQIVVFAYEHGLVRPVNRRDD